MRSFYRSLSGPLRRSIALVCLADAVVAVAFGAVTASAGLPIWLPVALSLAVFAGAAQFLFVAVLAAGGGPIAALAAAVLVNTRLVPLSLAVADVLGPGRLRTVAGGHLVTDESVAFANAERDERGRRAAFWGCGVALFTVWNAGVLLGTVAGRHVPDAAALGLDAAFPAVLLALVMPALRDRATLRTALVGAVIAVASAPFLPAGLPVLLALVALPLVRSAS
jgi:branched chain amino acid efflux pump